MMGDRRTGSWPFVDPSAAADLSDRSASYQLYVAGRPLAVLQWRAGRRGWGWFLHDSSGRRLQLMVDRGLEGDRRAEHSEDDELADAAAMLSLALALDEAGRILHGPIVSPKRPARRGRYELEVAHLDTEVADLAFPEAVAVSIGELCILAGELDDRALAVMTRRVALLGGRVLALFLRPEGP
jgi:hypothetical protein